MKTKEELNALKAEYEAVGKKLAELNEEELAEVTGGFLNLAGLNFWQKKGENSDKNSIVPLPY